MPSAFPEKDDSIRLVDQVHKALEAKQALRIRGGDSKAFLGRPVQAIEIDTRSHTGVVHYDPTELVVTVRAGTPVSKLNTLLAANGQHLPPEAPDFNGRATVGGMVAGALAGPRRPWAGSVRDHVLGCRVIDGQGRHMRFGGEVMKNVAGYDFSRLMAGSHGCLGLITEVSLKVLPLPRKTFSLALEIEPKAAMKLLAQWRSKAMPISGAFHWKQRLHLRLEGGEAIVDAARMQLGGEETSPGIWTDLRERRLAFFDSAMPLWRLSVPWQAPLLPLPGQILLDWAGAQRWLTSDASPQDIRSAAQSLGGHATCYTPKASDSPFQPLPEVLMRFHRSLKKQVDPQHMFNPGRMYAGL
ncbi:glycolate oxidase subunit GlcE [Pusillimonas sp.]|uniref:glycolate oxidase subunit GlcE n=1 Tax=Pusillimonas sp. TaxID=3040095 RepID=UPI0037CB5475